MGWKPRHKLDRVLHRRGRPSGGNEHDNGRPTTARPKTLCNRYPDRARQCAAHTHNTPNKRSRTIATKRLSHRTGALFDNRRVPEFCCLTLAVRAHNWTIAMYRLDSTYKQAAISAHVLRAPPESRDRRAAKDGLPTRRLRWAKSFAHQLWGGVLHKPELATQDMQATLEMRQRDVV